MNLFNFCKEKFEIGNEQEMDDFDFEKLCIFINDLGLRYSKMKLEINSQFNIKVKNLKGMEAIIIYLIMNYHTGHLMQISKNDYFFYHDTDIILKKYFKHND